jgi:ubiquinone biosynthesis protein
VPAVYEDYCSRGVLTMEYIEGVKPADAAALRQAGLDPATVARRGADFVLREIFEFGFFHTDPHPGNFFVLPGNVLAPIDFGQVARLTEDGLAMLTEVVLAIVDGDAVGVVAALRRAGMLEDQTDEEALVRDTAELLDGYYNLPLKDIPFRQAIAEAFEIIRSHRLRPPAEFTLMMTCLMTIESLASSLDSGVQIVEHLKPYARRLRLRLIDPRRMARGLGRAMREARDLAQRLPEDINVLASRMRRGQFQVRVHHEHLENLVRTVDKSSNRISFALIIAGLLIASSMLVAQPGQVLGLVSLQSLGVVGYLAAAVLGLWLVGSIMRSRHV